jgi:HSP90 family molecular chaperone
VVATAIELAADGGEGFEQIHLLVLYEEARFDDWANLLLEQATLAEGGTLDDPAGFVKPINDLMLALSGNAK